MPCYDEEKKPSGNDGKHDAPSKPTQRKKAPAKPKTWVDKHLIDPIMDPIMAMI